MLTSYLWRGLELNDGVNYLVAFKDAEFDNQNSANPTYAERQGRTPVFLGATLAEGEITVPIQIRFTSAQDEYDKLQALKAVFNTHDQTEYDFERRLRHQQYYQYIPARVKEFSYNPLERKATAVLHCEDKSWRDVDETVQTETIFSTVNTHTWNLTYEGNVAVNPIVKITSTEQTANGPTPQYWRIATLYAYDTSNLLGTPLLITQNWNTTYEVGQGWIRSDATDTSVVFADTGAAVRRVVGGTESNRKIWILPSQMPTIQPALINVLDPSSPDITSSQTTIPWRSTTTNPNWPTTGTIAIDDEIISYTGVTYGKVAAGGIYYGTFTGCGRGHNGTTAVSHVGYARIKRPINFKIRFGYGTGYEQQFYNDLTGWPTLDFTNSTNKSWVYTNCRFPLGIYPATVYQPTWALSFNKRHRKNTNIVGGSDTPVDMSGELLKLYGGYYSTAVEATADRIIVPISGGKRKPTSVRVQGKLRGSSLNSLPTGMSTVLVHSAYNTLTEVQTVLNTKTATGGSLTTFDTGTLDTGFDNKPFSHIVLEITAAPLVNSQTSLLELETLTIGLDADFGAYPILADVGGTQGVNLSLYPIYLAFRNATNSGVPFELEANLAVNGVITIDTDQRTVTGISIEEASYQVAEWLRLDKGVNQINFSGPAGIGQMDIEIRYRAKY